MPGSLLLLCGQVQLVAVQGALVAAHGKIGVAQVAVGAGDLHAEAQRACNLNVALVVLDGLLKASCRLAHVAEPGVRATLSRQVLQLVGQLQPLAVAPLRFVVLAGSVQRVAQVGQRARFGETVHQSVAQRQLLHRARRKGRCQGRVGIGRGRGAARKASPRRKR